MTGTLWVALLLLLGFLCQWLAWRVKLPAILFLLLAGIALGPVTGVLDPDEALGPFLFPLVSLGVAVILFEGSLTLRFAQVRGLAPAILSLVTLGAAIALGGLAAAAHYLAGLDWPLALLFGAIACVTGPTVIGPMLRSVRPNARIANVLRWEGIIIDPIGALLAVLMFEALALGSGDRGLEVLGFTVATGAAAGALGALVLSALLRRHWVPEYLQSYATLAALLLTFAGANAAAAESGLLAVTVMGVVLGNLRGLRLEDILDFKEHLSTLFVSILFIVLGARLDWPTPALGLAGLMVLAAAMLVVRPLSVLVATLGSNLSWRERALIAWMAPRGIVAAAVSALFALRLEERGIAGADALVPLTFLLIIGSVGIYSATALPLARALGVADPDPRGVLLVGTSDVALAIGEALQKLGFDVLVADEDWAGLARARMRGLPTWFGNPASEHAEASLDLIGIGNLLALSTRPELNTLVCVRYRPEFGKDHVYYLRNLSPEQARGRADFAEALSAPQLFGEQVTHAFLEERMGRGWSIRHTKLTASFGWKDLQAQYGEPPLLLFVKTERGGLIVADKDRPLEPKPGATVIALVGPERSAPDASRRPPTGRALGPRAGAQGPNSRAGTTPKRMPSTWRPEHFFNGLLESRAAQASCTLVMRTP